MKKLIGLLCLLSCLAGSAMAQDDAGVTEGVESLFFFYAPCETQAVFNLNGYAPNGYDVYVQVFDQVGGAGNPLTNLIRVPVDGLYEVSQVIPYLDGKSLLLGQFASATLSLARESDATDSLLSFTNDDVRGECIEPTYPLVDSLNSSSSGNSTPLVDPVTGQIITGAEVVSSAGIYTPDGGVLNEVIRYPQEAIVQIGARRSDLQTTTYEGRVSDAGLIFAECNQYPLADPGIVWDTDTVTIFWSWYATTPEQAQAHLDNAAYEVFLSSPYAHRQPFPRVTVSPITEREDGNYYLFYTANLGDGFRPGEYRVDYYVTWNEKISDGYAEFGPESETPFILSSCTFDVARNPFGLQTDLNNPTVPLQQP